jgi:hypothetical protein
MYPTVQLLHANKKAGHGAACLSSQLQQEVKNRIVVQTGWAKRNTPSEKEKKPEQKEREV